MRFHTSLKVASGYVLLALVLAGTVGYIYRQTRSLADVSAAETAIVHRRQAATHLVSRLFIAENLSQTASLGGKGAHGKYAAAVDSVLAAADSLDAMLADTLQHARLDTLRRLVVDKMECTARLLAVRSDRPLAAAYQQRIDALRAGLDSVLVHPAVQQRVVEVQRSYTVERTSRNFFRRLGDVFRRPRTDTTEVKQNEQVHSADTLVQDINVADSVAAALADIHRDAARREAASHSRAKAREEAVRAVGAELSRRIGELLRAIETEEALWMDEALRYETAARRRAVWTVGGLAAVAAVLALGLTCWVWRDIRRAARYRAALEEAKQQAEQLLEQREQLMLTVTHDIKAPVSSILGYLELLRSGADGQQAARYVGYMQGAADHLLHLVTALLDFHRLDAGKMDVHTGRFDPGRLFVETVEALRPIAEKKGLELRAEVDISVCRTCAGDAFRLRQIAENLLTNALKFTAEGSITLRASWADGTLTFSVKDTGCGMTLVEQRRIFDAFTRLSSAQGQEGVGLGLAITKKLVDLLGGKLEVASERGQGSTFTVALPLEETEDAPETGGEEKDSPAPAGRRVLLIDDDRLQLRLTVEMLDRLSGGKGRVVACTQPEELFDRLREETFDVVLTDIQMPAMGGFDLLRQLRASGGKATQIPVVAVTARSDMTEEALREAGFAACLHKPFNLHELAGALARAGAGETGTPPQPAAGREETGAETNPFAALTAFADGDAAAGEEILRTFRDETARHSESFAAAMAAKDKAEICRLAHKILPAFTLIGAAAAADMRLLEARRAETAWTPADDAPAARVATALRQTLRQLDERLGRQDYAHTKTE